MLRELHFVDTGPAREMSMAPVAPRINLLTGDNGLGKSFLLEAAWWALTRTWHEWPIAPNRPSGMIGCEFDGDKKVVREVSRWDPMSRSWKRKPGRPANPGLVLYARVDGSFSVWDPARNYRLYKRPDGSAYESPAAYQFSAEQVLYGLHRPLVEGSRERPQVLCNGLVADWTLWQRAKEPNFDLLTALLARLGPEGETLEPGEPVYAAPGDDRVFPTVRMSYGRDVPITYAPAGVQRMSKLAYLLAWALGAHERESAEMGIAMSRQVTVLIDEPETHLHPRWQRTVVPSLHEAIRGWHAEAAPDVQFLVATHSPLVLASMEPIFDPEQDALWVLDLVDGERVELKREPWTRHGDANRWLTSAVFDLDEARSLAAERAINGALALLRANQASADEVRDVTVALKETLGDTDRFWVRWSEFAAKHGVDA